mgnify:FL=1
MYALIEFAGKQFKVENGSKIKVPYISDKVGQKINIDKVLYFDNDKEKIVGAPYIDGVSFDAKIVEHGKEKKIIVFKFKRRKGHQKKNGHRQQFSLIEFGKLSGKSKATAKTKATSTTKKTSTKKEK